ncbi:MAG: type III pantothenate kinase [Candidatus Scalindua sp.]|nr:type III pantothenate kinase [Candidatus Scalindua sp.]
MILAVDIGNTNINMGSFRENKLVSHSCINGESLMQQRTLFSLDSSLLNEIQYIVIASVNPGIESAFYKYLDNEYTKKVLKIMRDIQLSMPVLVDKPEKVGVDRLVNALAAFKRTETSTIVIDFGTAITFDIVSKGGEFLGGLIMPGLETSAFALNKRTAYLPKVDIKKPDKIIGKDTNSAILSGIYNGTVGAVLYILKEIQRELGSVQSIVTTGGDARKFIEDLPQDNMYIPHLTLEGIKIAFEESID